MGHFRAGHPGHGIIGDHNVVNPGIEKRQGFFGAADGIDGETEIGEKPFGGHSAIVNIVDEEDRLQGDCRRVMQMD